MHLLRQLNQLPDPVRRNRAVQKCRDNGDHTVERRGKIASLLQEQCHRSICNIVRPQTEQTVSECNELDHRSEDRQEDICLDGEQIVLQADIPELALPPAHFLAVMGRHAEGLDRVKVVKRLHLESHQLTAHLPDLLAVVSLFLDHEPGHQEHDRRASQRDHRHDPVIMHDHKKCSDKIINRDYDRRKPADRIAADRADIPVEPVEDIAIGILVQRQPVRVHDLVKDIRLNIIVDINAQLRRDPADDTAECQAENRASPP